MDVLPARKYTSWEQVAGYFDGDGSISIFIWKCVIAFYLDWADQCGEQLNQIVVFLRSQRIRTGVVRKMTNASAYAPRIADQESVLLVAEKLAPYCYKKRPDLEVLLDYRKRDLISGTVVQQRFKRFVDLGIRERHGNRRVRAMPWAYSVGLRLSRKGRALLYHGLGKKLSESQKREARERHNVFGESISALSRSYGVSRSMVWRALKHD